jgi:endonuclease-3
VNAVTEMLFKRYRSAKSYAEAPRRRIERDIHATGFFRRKARFAHRMGKGLVSDTGASATDVED